MTLGNFERNIITETKQDIENVAKVATLTAVALPVGVAIGGGLLGYGMFRGAQFIGAGLSDIEFPDLNPFNDGTSALGFLTFGLYDDLANSVKEDRAKKREEEGLPPEEEKSSAQNLSEFLLFVFTGKGIIW
jgi:hypothetical protein